jgi:hypothetical protein
MGAQMKQALVDNCTAEDRRARELTDRAGMDLVPEARGRKEPRASSCAERPEGTRKGRLRASNGGIAAPIAGLGTCLSSGIAQRSLGPARRRDGASQRT